MSIRKIIRSLWLFFCWTTLLIVVLAAFSGIYALYRINARLRYHVQAELEKRFPRLEIDVGSVRLVERKGISVRHLEYSIPGEAGRPKRLILAVEEMFLESPVTLQALLRKEVRIDRIILRNSIFRLTRDADGRFEELRRFHAEPSSNRAMPIEVSEGILLYEDLAAESTAPLKISGVCLTLTPPEGPTRPTLLSDLENNTPPPTAWKIDGSARGDLFRQLTFRGNYDPSNGHWELGADCRQFDWTPDLCAYARLRRPLVEKSAYRRSIESFQGRFDWTLSARSDPDAAAGFRFALDGILSQGRAEFYEIKRTLSELNTRFRITDDSIVVEQLTGIGEAARLVFSYVQDGLTQPRSATLATRLRGLTFDGELARVLAPFLNAETKRLLAQYDYRGTADLDAEMSFRDGRWKPKTLSMNLSELTFSYRPFPYKVERVRGHLHVDETARLVFRLNSREEEPVKAEIVGEYQNVFVDPVGEVRIRGREVPIDAKLLDSLPKEQRRVVESLRPEGKINATLSIKLPPNDQPLEKRFAIGLNNISIRYDRFPYPLRDICGELHLDDETWTFQNIAGTNEAAYVQCGGYLKPAPVLGAAPDSGETTTEFLLRIQAEELPLNGQLAEALLDPDQRNLLAGLRARGKINLDAQILYRSHDNRLHLEFLASPCPETSIYPVQFPYRIENVQGVFHYKDGVVRSKQLQGRNRETELKTGVVCRFDSDGRWMLRLDPLTVNRLPSHREILDALPSKVQNTLEGLQVRKPFNLEGSLELSKQGEEAPLRTAWDLVAVLHQNDARIGIPVENVFGKIGLVGYSEGDDFRLAGELKLDSLTVKGFQATELSGPFFYDGSSNQFYVGQTAGKRLPPPPPDLARMEAFRHSPWFVGTQQTRPIAGRLFGGTVFGSGLVVMNNGVSYSIHTDLVGASLAQIAQELEPNARRIAGTINCRSSLWGEGYKMETLGGKGTIELRNADIYEAPGMVRLLRELSIREIDPNAGAFSSSDIDFRIQGHRVVLNSIIFEGGVFSLTGSGEMRIDNREVNLIMKTRLGNRRTQIPVISDILGGAGDQIIQLNVQGPITDPTVSRVALPEIRKAIQQIQGEETTDYGQFTPPPNETKAGPPRLSPAKWFPWK